MKNRKIKLFKILYLQNYKSAKLPYGEKHPRAYSGIEFKGEFNYIKELNLVYNKNIQNDLYYNGQPCIYTDNSFPKERPAYYGECVLRPWNSRKAKKYSIFSLMRFLSKVKGIPKNTKIELSSGEYIPHEGRSYSLDFEYKIQNVTKFPKFNYQTSNVKKMI